MENQFDVIIIGSGPGGMAAAYDLAAAGKKIAVVEADKWGGTCPNRGCDPKKILYHGVAAGEAVAQLKGAGYAGKPAVNWEELMAFKKDFTDAVPKEQKGGLESAGITVIEGTAVFENEHTIIVSEKSYTADTFILATGQHSALLDIPGKEHLETSTEFLELPSLPEKMAFIGGGYIAFELANIAHSSGSEVHIIHHNQKPLKGFEQEQVNALIQLMKSKGIIFHFDEEVEKIEKTDDLLKATLASGDMLEVNRIFCSTGRIANVEGMNLEGIGINYSARGIEVDSRLRTSVKNIYSLGDCLAKKKPKLTPVSSFEGGYLAKLLSGKIDEEISYPEIPTILFASPKLAQVGKTEVTPDETEHYEVQDLDVSQWFTYKYRKEPLAMAKVVVDKQTGLLAGASVLSNEADELINLLTLVINQKLPKENINQLIMLYPTVASDISYLY
ncbi:dihydrolipoyl dehydrogenase family protein [Enterococcus sp. LJL128]